MKTDGFDERAGRGVRYPRPGRVEVDPSLSCQERDSETDPRLAFGITFCGQYSRRARVAASNYLLLGAHDPGNERRMPCASSANVASVWISTRNRSQPIYACRTERTASRRERVLGSGPCRRIWNDCETGWSSTPSRTL